MGFFHELADGTFVKLSDAQQRGILAMGDMGYNLRYTPVRVGVWMVSPPVNGRTLAVLERHEIVQRDGEGMWRLTSAGFRTYTELASLRHAAINEQCATALLAEVEPVDTCGNALYATESTEIVPVVTEVSVPAVSGSEELPGPFRTPRKRVTPRRSRNRW